MLYRTLTHANARKSPGYAGKPNSDVIHALPAGVLLDSNGEQDADGLTWVKSAYNGDSIWVAKESPNGTPILLEVAGDETDFDKAFMFVIKHEGGFVDDKNDMGGATKYGISQRSYPSLDIKGLTLNQARQIYFADYWQRSGAQYMTWPLNLVHFDAAVNCGIGQAGKFLEQSNHDASRYLDLRREFYKGLKQFGLFGAGWIRRVDELAEVAFS